MSDSAKSSELRALPSPLTPAPASRASRVCRGGERRGSSYRVMERPGPTQLMTGSQSILSIRQRTHIHEMSSRRDSDFAHLEQLLQEEQRNRQEADERAEQKRASKGHLIVAHTRSSRIRNCCRDIIDVSDRARGFPRSRYEGR